MSNNHKVSNNHEVNQTTFEHTLHPYHLSKDIKEYILQEYSNDINHIQTVLEEYLSQSYWDSKNQRLSILKSKDIKTVILNVLSQVILLADDYLPLLTLCSSISFGLSKYHDIQTVADIIWCINDTELIYIDIQDDTRYIKSNMELSDDLKRRLSIMCVLPPMITKPKTLRHNKSCGYLTIKQDSLILANKENHHDKCISLDVLNTLNQQALQLDLDICYRFEKEFTGDTSDEIATKSYEKAKEQFEFFRDTIQDNTIHFTHKVDKRGRVYSQGYTFNCQGTSYEKACINLKTKEYVTGEL